MAEIDPLALTLDDRVLLEELITKQIRRVRNERAECRFGFVDLRGHSAYRLERLYEKVRRLDVKAGT